MEHNILITGANSGLGEHLSKKFLNQGHNIVTHKGRKHFDLRDASQILKLRDLAVKEKVTVLINNAAVVCPSLAFEDYDVEMINTMIDVNLRAPIILSYCLLPYLTDIININSMVGLEIKSPRTLYSATKWGLRGFSNSLKKELKNMNKHVNILDVYPTNIKTHPEKENAMDVGYVVEKIYRSFIEKEEELILDGRPK